MKIKNFTRHFDRLPGIEERTPLQVLEMVASRGEPEALEMLRTIPHHQGKIIGSAYQRAEITARIESIVTRIFVAEDIEISFSGSLTRA